MVKTKSYSVLEPIDFDSCSQIPNNYREHRGLAAQSTSASYLQ